MQNEQKIGDKEEFSKIEFYNLMKHIKMQKVSYAKWKNLISEKSLMKFYRMDA